MQIKRTAIGRRYVIESYAKYDCAKRDRPVPDFGQWDWSSADKIDAHMRDAELKIGVPAGFLLWDEVNFSIADLYEFAICDQIFPGEPRSLGLIDIKKIAEWKPNRQTSWWGPISSGLAPNNASPMLFRPAVRSELPARWYVEDGSGRVTALFSKRHLFDQNLRMFAFLARQPDHGSAFMRCEFPELLQQV